ncbi:MAG TPA: thioredoxin-dependent thiol peroxidase [Sphingobium sp.]
MLTTGDKLPEVVLAGSDGASITLSDHVGKPLVLYFYPKADTPGCTNEALDFSALKGDFDALGVPVIGISRDTPAKLAKFAAKHALTVTLASDGDGAVCEAFGTWIEKKLYGREYMGIARATFLFDASGTAVRVWPSVKVKGHAAEVLEAVRALG